MRPPALARVPMLRHLSRRSLRSDEAGALPVFEAIIAGMLVLTAILFLTAIGRPAPSSGQSGIDLGQNAADTLGILRDRDADNTLVYPDRLSEIVDQAMKGNSADAKDFLDEIVPLGTRYLLRLDNGVEPLVLLPHGSGPALTPRAAQAASVLVVPDWTIQGKPSENLGLDTIRPGQQIPAGHPAGVPAGYAPGPTLAGLFSPVGGAMMPDGTTTWAQHWYDHEGVAPADVPYGVWKMCDPADCSNIEQWFKVVGPTGNEADYPIYGVQLVVWLAA